ncbi:MAG TPA: protein-glutamine glutaminase family protein [Vicinamibacterales bacterium]|nr:protein-glutamine glutaminase family protein [Vicinamibacterales bacterium]
MAITRESGLVTVAGIRTGGNRPPRYLFHEHEPIFTLASNAADEGSLRRLEAARRSRRPVRVTLDEKAGVIQAVLDASPAEADEFARARPLMKGPSRIARLDLRRIDPTTFNLAETVLKWPAFRKCHDIIPTYKKARDIFDFCAGLSCHLLGPPTVSPCIPFQYVIDGCYARAHQMRRIITGRFRYCCEKVFSFATDNDDTLAVKADKWGGCCVEWWYHVAPLVRVRVKVPGLPKKFTIALAMVIDPGMFDKPVLLSTWLAAQENLSCNANAHLTSYSIQPGSAYTPYYGGGFTTDPSYTATESTLIAYSGLTTC